jgi:hypothetical protein
VRWLTAPGVLAAAAGLTAALGGFRPAEAPPPPQLTAGRVIDQGLFSTQALRAYAGRRADLISDPTKRWLTVEFRVVNTSDETRDPMEFAAHRFQPLIPVALPSGRVDPVKFIARVDRGSWKSEQVPPRTPVRLIVAWYDWVGPVPAQVTVSLPAFEHRAPVFFDMPVTWQPKRTANQTPDTDDDPVAIAARVTVPVVRQDFP